MRERQLKSMIVNSVHDSIVIDTYPNEEGEVKDCILKVEQSIRSKFLSKLEVDFDVPLIMDCKIGKNWMDLEKYT